MGSVTDIPTVVNLTDTHHCDDSHDLTASVLPPILIIEMMLGLPGSLLALWVFWFRMKHWKPSTLLLFNLLLADFLLIISLPFRIHNFLTEEYWEFGGAWCRINLFMLAVNRSSSIGFMTAVAVDRYIKVVHPHHRINRMTTTQAAGVAILIWTIVIALRVPLLTLDLLRQDGNYSLCRSFDSYEKTPPQIMLHNFVFVAEFFLPLMVLLFCTARIVFILYRRRMDKDKKVRRAIRAVGAIVTVFIVCFMPGIATGLATVYIKKFHPNDCKPYRLAAQLFTLSIGFTYLNSALDPIIYCFSSVMFSNVLKTYVNRLGLVEMKVRRRSTTTSDG